KGRGRFACAPCGLLAAGRPQAAPGPAVTQGLVGQGIEPSASCGTRPPAALIKIGNGSVRARLIIADVPERRQIYSLVTVYDSRPRPVRAGGGWGVSVCQ